MISSAQSADRRTGGETTKCRWISRHLARSISSLICTSLFSRKPLRAGPATTAWSMRLAGSIEPDSPRRAVSASGSLMLKGHLDPSSAVVLYIAQKPTGLHRAGRLDLSLCARFYLCSVTAAAASDRFRPLLPADFGGVVRGARLGAAAAPDRAPGQGAGRPLGAADRADRRRQDARRLPAERWSISRDAGRRSPASPSSACTRSTSRR